MLAASALYWHPQLSQWRYVTELLQVPGAHPTAPAHSAPPRPPAAQHPAPPPGTGTRPGTALWVPILAGTVGVGFLVVLVTVIVLSTNPHRDAQAEAAPASTVAEAPTATQIATRALPSTVLIRTDKMLGSGFLVAANTVATNFHVIDGARGAIVHFSSENTAYPVIRALMVDKFHDLAILEVDLPTEPVLPLGPDEYPPIGDDIYVIGAPEGLENTFSKGNISQIRATEKGDRLQITAPISHGSSGGPVLNTSGEVIGVTVSTTAEGQNLNFAVPVRYVRKLLLSIGSD